MIFPSNWPAFCLRWNHRNLSSTGCKNPLNLNHKTACERSFIRQWSRQRKFRREARRMHMLHLFTCFYYFRIFTTYFHNFFQFSSMLSLCHTESPLSLTHNTYFPSVPTSIAMASGMRAARTITRRFASAAEALDKSATKGPKLPAGNDPSAYHSKLHAVGTCAHTDSKRAPAVRAAPARKSAWLTSPA